MELFVAILELISAVLGLFSGKEEKNDKSDKRDYKKYSKEYYEAMERLSGEKKVNEYIGNVPYWTCEKCGKKNAEYVGSCGCGYSVRKTISQKQNDSNNVKISKALLEKK